MGEKGSLPAAGLGDSSKKGVADKKPVGRLTEDRSVPSFQCEERSGEREPRAQRQQVKANISCVQVDLSSL